MVTEGGSMVMGVGGTMVMGAGSMVMEEGQW